MADPETGSAPGVDAGVERAAMQQAQKALAAAVQRYRMVIAGALDAAITIDGEGNVTEWNTQAEAIFGWRETEVLGAPLVDLIIPSRYRLDHKRGLARAAATGEGPVLGQRIEIEAVRRDGTEFPVELTITPLKLNDHYQFAAFVRDITDRRRAIEDQSRLAAIVESSTDAIIGKSLDGVITSWNPASERLYGYSADEAIGRPLSIIVAPDREAEIEELLARVIKGEPVVNHVTERRHKDGHVVTISLSMSPVHDRRGELIGVSGIGRDVTEQIRLEAAAEADRARRAEAEQLAQQRTIERGTAERANAAKSEFLSRMSHELRTPLNAVLGFAQLLQLSGLEGDNAESVDQIIRAGDHLLALINEVLDIARIESGRLALSMEPVPIDDVLRDAIDLVRPLATRRGITIDVTERRQPALHVQADGQRLLQVVLNLLSNAVKYNDERGHVQIASDADEHRVRLSVTDTGPGLAAADLDRVFMPFERLGAEQSAIEGTGVGLALSRALTEAMGGHIGVESTPERGSTFWVDLPRTRPPSLRRTPIDPSSADARSRQLVVLCIEDNVASANLIEHVLHLRPNVMLHTAMQGTLGLDLARTHHPDLILLDVHLPDLDGADVLAELRRDPTTRDIPVVVVSADATPSQRSRLREMGAAQYLTKPLHVNELLDIVDRLARHHQIP